MFLLGSHLLREALERTRKSVGCLHLPQRLGKQSPREEMPSWGMELPFIPVDACRDHACSPAALMAKRSRTTQSASVYQPMPLRWPNRVRKTQTHCSLHLLPKQQSHPHPQGAGDLLWLNRSMLTHQIPLLKFTWPLYTMIISTTGGGGSGGKNSQGPQSMRADGFAICGFPFNLCSS